MALLGINNNGFSLRNNPYKADSNVGLKADSIKLDFSEKNQKLMKEAAAEVTISPKAIALANQEANRSQPLPKTKTEKPVFGTMTKPSETVTPQRQQIVHQSEIKAAQRFSEANIEQGIKSSGIVPQDKPVMAKLAALAVSAQNNDVRALHTEPNKIKSTINKLVNNSNQVSSYESAPEAGAGISDLPVSPKAAAKLAGFQLADAAKITAPDPAKAQNQAFAPEWESSFRGAA